VTIDIIPDDVLLEIFAFYVEEASFYSSKDKWHTLVHVCRTWRILVFRSPRRLNLQLQCGTSAKPVPSREMLGIWPPLPLVLEQYGHLAWDTDNIMAILEHTDRVCEITLELWDASGSQFKKALVAMQEPFPALTILQLRTRNVTQVIPNSFLGGSAPRLQALTLDEIAFPGLRKLLPSATHLIDLDLRGIPHSGYISPEAMVTCLSALTRLQTLCLTFQSPQSHPDRESRRPLLLTRSILPALTDFVFHGVSEYLEDFVARIDSPMLDDLDITFFYQVIFDIPNLPQFISRTPSLKAHDEACVDIFKSGVCLGPVRLLTRGFKVELELPVGQSGWPLPSPFAQVCRSSFPHTFFSSWENLYIRDRTPAYPWDDEIENAQWLELLHLFTSVKNIYLSEKVTPLFAPVLKEIVEERIVEILPALQGLFLEEARPARPVRKAISQFVAARQLSSHPITVSRWVKEENADWY
jgi:hypothetical protein